MRKSWIAIAKWTCIAVGAVLGAALALFLYARTESGLDAVARLAHWVTDGDVTITHLRGSFPGALRVAKLELRDKTGTWMIVEGAEIDWSPLALAANHVRVSRLVARRVQWLRLPVDDESEESSDMRIDVASLDVARAETAPAIAGTALVFDAHGSVHYVSLTDVAANLTLRQQGGQGSYRVNGAIVRNVATGDAVVFEPANGLIAGLLGLNEIGALRLDAHATQEGAVNRIALSLAAGALKATGNGSIDLSRQSMDIAFLANAPEMAITPDLSWNALNAQGQVHGPFLEPRVNGTLDLENLRSTDIGADRFHAEIRGANGAVDFNGTVAGFRLAGPEGDLFAHDPVQIRGRAMLADAALPISFTLSHPLLAANGTVNAGTGRRATITVDLPKLEPFAAFGGQEFAGKGSLKADVVFAQNGFHIGFNGTISASGARSVAERLLGANATLAINADVNGGTIVLSQARVNGAAFSADVSGSMRGTALDLDIALKLPDMARVTPSLQGDVAVTASARGPVATARLQVQAIGNIASRGFAKQRVTVTASANGLPKPEGGVFRGNGRFNDAPVALNGAFGWKGPLLTVSDVRGDWKSLHIRADALVDAGKPSGKADLTIGDLGDIGPLVEQKLQGAVMASLILRNTNTVLHGDVSATVNHLAVEDTRVEMLSVSGDIAGVDEKPKLALQLNASGIAAGGFTGEGKATVNGALDALAIALDAALKDADDHPAKLNAAIILDTETSVLRISALTARYSNQTATLRMPATILYGDGVTVHDFSATVGGGELIAEGRFTPIMAASVSLKNVGAAALQPFLPLSQGTLSGMAQLSGAPAAPDAHVTLEGRGLRFTGSSAGLAPASLDAKADAHAGVVVLAATVSTGTTTRLQVSGSAPLGGAGALDLKAQGTADLALLNPILSAEGRNLTGTLALNAAVAGTVDKPVISGTALLSDGEIQDHARGFRIRDIALNARFAEDTLHIEKLSGRAGRGTITGSGTVGVMAEGLPVDMRLQAQDARPVASDTLRADLDADLTLKGRAREQLALTGTVTMLNGESVLPDSFPPSVVTLTVLRPGQTQPVEKEEKQTQVALDISLRSPGQFFVRGRGLDAELQGNIHVGGTAANPVVTGGLTMRRGSLDLAGETIAFTTGRVTFDGAGLKGQIDPTLDFVAETASAGVVARLAVAGYASAPRIQLSSTPPMPQDEVLARVLFQQSVKQLSAFQLAEIAQAAASLGGVGSGFNPLASVRRGLGLDRLSVSSAGSGTEMQTTIGAGKYLAPGIYVGAKQGLGNSTQAEVQVDLTDQLKAKATVSAGSNATVTQGAGQQDTGSSLGLSYQFEY